MARANGAVIRQRLEQDVGGRHRASCPRCGRAPRAQDVDQARFRVLFGPCPDHRDRGVVAVDLRSLAVDLGWRVEPEVWEEVPS